ncbi:MULTISPECIES: hypothetical protein [Morganellaceae]|uniref:Uncharacterized protein n=1 Tax=Providencia rettgeri TaxID=587 RepID=A0AAJ6G0E9_PRORE|nr:MULTISPECIES: hypothetical protein [Providencia]MBZ3683305.1 hypothetical protein [Providencia rettgeri]MCK9789430.1 hypothetical protein [Providencia rettgeri]MDB9569418.1 hypothetical protein [Providencia rettgeri]MDT1982436.1 hypothetical protein [Providencia huaxiensis]MDX7426104.1 hypothetical protein [Providencia sp. CIM-Carb-044]
MITSLNCFLSPSTQNSTELTCFPSSLNPAIKADPSLHANIINNIEEFAESMRNSLGEVDEEDISAYAHSVADSMEEFLPLTEDEINSIEFMK